MDGIAVQELHRVGFPVDHVRQLVGHDDSVFPESALQMRQSGQLRHETQTGEQSGLAVETPPALQGRQVQEQRHHHCECLVEVDGLCAGRLAGDGSEQVHRERPDCQHHKSHHEVSHWRNETALPVPDCGTVGVALLLHSPTEQEHHGGEDSHRDDDEEQHLDPEGDEVDGVEDVLEGLGGFVEGVGLGQFGPIIC